VVERTRGLVGDDTKGPEMARTMSGKSGKSGPLSAGLGSGPKKVRVVEPGGSQGGEGILGGEEQVIEEATSKSEP